MSSNRFLQRFLALVLLGWVIPPAFGMLFIAFVDIFAYEDIRAIMFSWPMTLFVLASTAFAGIYFYRFAQPVTAYLAEPGAPGQPAAALERVKAFPLHFWAIFLLTLLLAPNVVMLVAQEVPHLQLQAIDWFRIHLVALSTSILIGLPLFFLLIDLFGQTLGPVFLGKPHITIRMKVFLIGSLVPLLIDTILVQYYWGRTGYFTTETFLVWLLLELIAVAGSLLFMRSFGQSLVPLENLLRQGIEHCEKDLSQLTAASTDELGVLINEYRRMLEHHGQIEQRLRKSERDLNNILYNMQDIFYRTDVDGNLIYITAMAEHTLGYSPRELLGTSLESYCVEPDSYKSIFSALQKNNGVVRNFITRMRHKNGSVVWTSTNAHCYMDESGEIAGVEGNTRDITQLKLAELALEKETQRALVTLESIGDGVVTTDTSGRIEYLNPVAERLLDCDLDDVRGRDYMDVIKLFHEGTGEALHDLVELILRRDSAMVHADDGVLSHRDGSQFTINITAAPMRSQDEVIVGVVLVLHDITEVMGMARQLSFQASHDMLTGLYNRREFEKRLDLAIREARSADKHHVLFYMDLDQFKVVNDTSGHRAGDELLTQLAQMLMDAVREHDTLARLGGDEFGLLLMDCPLDKARELADKLRQQIRDFRFAWKDRVFEVGVSIGVVPITAVGGSLIDVLSIADGACYVAKEAGRNRVHVADDDDKAVARHHREMEWVHRIAQAFEEERFELFYQAIAPLRTSQGSLPRGEVLMRMRDESGETLSPMAFIPAAERYNLMPTIDRWVVRTALGKLREAQGPAMAPPFRCTINLSGQSLADEHFLDFVLNQFHECDINGDFVCFEITETAAITNLSRARHFIATLKRLGCYFALDDFGSGLSSFGYLKGLQVDYIKIDGSFVKDMVEDNLDRAMVESINQIGHVVGMETIAEFAENDAIIDVLREIGVDYAQGYAIASPEPLEAVVQRLRYLDSRVSK
ncbi:MAG: EAL domain-containing protein [Gammaproteobacteria bacterium]|nr:EAL domain-containing protein [Gammaproteobacteria bacterium]MCW8971741.1 EAL domain-containing protein [Gammaproteobacteria bacterium]MCW8993354.1 EAL domain-containing protein [Gammaproteobacteria bacterium]